MSDEDGERFEELARGVLSPLVLGGTLRLVRPFGPTAALRFADGRTLADAGLRSELDVARVRRARLLAPVDTLPDLDASEWAMVAALNDLLQSANHELGGLLLRGRHARLLASTRALCARIPPPGNIGAALARHATFARVLELARKDTSVTWWTGSAKFRGQAPPARLLAWRELRRVQVDTTLVRLAEMPEGLPALSPEEFLGTLSGLLALSPLSDLATVTRAAPTFAWSRSSLALVAIPAGRTLAWRALSRLPEDRALACLERATEALSGSLPAEHPARAIARGFCQHVEEEVRVRKSA